MKQNDKIFGFVKKRKVSARERSQWEAISAARASLDKYLMGLENVVAVFSGFKTRRGKLTSEPAIVVGVSKKVEAGRLHPSQVVPMSIKVSHRNRAHEIQTDVLPFGRPSLAGRLDNGRPVMGGDSMGVLGIREPGCMGVRVWDNVKQRAAFLTCSHVLLLNNPGSYVVIKPGEHDGGRQTDRIGEFDPARCRPSSWDTATAAYGVDSDVGLVYPDNDSDVSLAIRDVSSWSGRFGELLWPDHHLFLCFKSGRSTGLTVGVFVGYEGTIVVNGLWTHYGAGAVLAISPDAADKIAKNSFNPAELDAAAANEIFADGGDSGAAILSKPVDQYADVVGILFATTMVPRPDGGFLNYGFFTNMLRIRDDLNVSEDRTGSGWEAIRSAFFRREDRELLRWLERNRPEVSRTAFGVSLMRLYDRLKRKDIPLLLLGQPELLKAGTEVVALGRKLVASKRARVSSKDAGTVSTFLDGLRPHVPKSDLEDLERIRHLAKSSVGKGAQEILDSLRRDGGSPKRRNQTV